MVLQVPPEVEAVRLRADRRSRRGHRASPRPFFSGSGGVYHWCRLTNGLTAAQLNERLFPMGAAVLEGTDCDMARRGDDSALRSFFRFSFGPLAPESFDQAITLMRRALDA